MEQQQQPNQDKSPSHIEGREVEDDRFYVGETGSMAPDESRRSSKEMLGEQSGNVLDDREPNISEPVDQRFPLNSDYIGCHYEDTARVQEDPNPTVEHRFLDVEGAEQFNTRNVFVRYLRPPTPPPNGPLIVQEIRDPDPAPLPPLVIRETFDNGDGQPQPPPLFLRQCPPPKPVPLPAQVITKRFRPRIPPAFRQKIIERYPLHPPPRPRDIIIEKWLPYPEPPKRNVIYQRSAPLPTRPLYPTPKNKIVNYHFAQRSQINKRVINLGVCRADPDSYYFRDCLSENQIMSQLQQIGLDHNTIMMPSSYPTQSYPNRDYPYNDGPNNMNGQYQPSSPWIPQDNFHPNYGQDNVGPNQNDLLHYADCRCARCGRLRQQTGSIPNGPPFFNENSYYAPEEMVIPAPTQYRRATHNDWRAPSSDVWDTGSWSNNPADQINSEHLYAAATAAAAAASASARSRSQERLFKSRRSRSIKRFFR